MCKLLTMELAKTTRLVEVVGRNTAAIVVDYAAPAGELDRDVDLCSFSIEGVFQEAENRIAQGNNGDGRFDLGYNILREALDG